MQFAAFALVLAGVLWSASASAQVPPSCPSGLATANLIANGSTGRATQATTNCRIQGGAVRHRRCRYEDQNYRRRQSAHLKPPYIH